MNLSLRTGVLKSLAWGSVLLCWAGWVIAMSGLSALQNDCGEANLPVVRLGIQINNMLISQARPVPASLLCMSSQTALPEGHVPPQGPEEHTCTVYSFLPCSSVS